MRRSASILNRFNNEEKLKQNEMINSRLEQSIKPFTTIREQSLSCSKRQQSLQSKSRSKYKKGISRVQSAGQIRPQQQFRHSGKISVIGREIKNQQKEQGGKSNDIEPPLSNKKPEKFTITSVQNKYSIKKTNGLQMVRQKTQEQQQSSLNYQKNPFAQITDKSLNPNPYRNQNSGSKYNTGSSSSDFVLKNKMKSLQSQITILEQSNSDKDKINSDLLLKYETLSSEKMQEKRKLEQQIQELKKQNKQLNQLKIKLDKKCIQYSQKQLSLSKHIRQLQTNIKPSFGNFTEQQKKSLENQIMQSRQKYRQLLIRSSMIQQENSSLHMKNQYYYQQVTKLENRNDKFEEIMKQIEIENFNLLNKAKLADQYYKDLTQLYPIKKQYESSKILIAKLEEKIKQNQHVRADQTSYHFTQLRQLKKQKQLLSEENLKLKAEKQEIIRSNEIQLLCRESKNKEYSKSYEANTFWQHQCKAKEKIIAQMRNDYEQLVKEMRNKIQNLQSQKRIIQVSRENLIAKFDEQRILRNELQKQLSSQKQNYNTQSHQVQLRQSRSPSPSRIQRNYDSRQSYPRSGLKSTLQNLDYDKKLQHYELLISKLEDKIHIHQVETEKIKNKNQSLQRKIIHLQDELKIVEKDKQNLLNEKINILEELQTCKQVIKHKAGEIQVQSKNISLLEKQINQKQTQKQQIFAHNKNLQQINKELRQQSKILEQRCEVNVRRISEYIESLQKLQEQKLKYKQYIKLMQHDKQIKKQKQTIEEEIKIDELSKQILQINTQNQNHFIKRKDFYERILNTIKSNTFQKFSKIQTKQEQQNVLALILKQLDVFINANSNSSSKANQYQQICNEHLQTIKSLNSSMQSYKNRCLELEEVLKRIEIAHKQKLVFVKEDYDVVYAKYMKYRNMVLQCKNKNCHKN